MKYEKVVGREINGNWVLFRLPNGTAAYVEKNGNVGFFYSWAQALRFCMIDARGPGCVPAEELRNAIEVMKKTSEDDEWYKHESDKRKRYAEQGGVENLDQLEKEHEEWCRNAETHPDGSLKWGYNP